MIDYYGDDLGPDAPVRRARGHAAPAFRYPPGWYWSGMGIAWCGPFDTEEAARKSAKLTPEAREEQRRKHGTEYPYPHDLKVWEE